MRFFVLFFSLLISTRALSQHEAYEVYKRQLDSIFTVHHLIRSGVAWPEIRAYLGKEPNDKSRWLHDLAESVDATISYRNKFPVVISPDTASLDALLAILMDTCGRFWYPRLIREQGASIGDDSYSFDRPNFVSVILTEITRRGKSTLPGLIRHLDNTAATRTIVDNGDSSQEMPYSVRVCDFALNLIEWITRCDFLDYSQGHIFSAEQPDVQTKVKQNIQDWWASNKDSTLLEGIVWQIKNRYFTTKMCQTVASLGEKDMAARLLKEEYYRYRKPENTCFPSDRDLEVARVLEKEYNIDVALEDCANSITNYRCTGGESEAMYILTYDSTGFWFMALAEVVATEPYSTFYGHQNGNTWKTIFSNIIGVEIEDENVLRVLEQLMKRKENVFGSNSGMSAYGWSSQYPDAAKNNFRVCDLALLRWRELAEKWQWIGLREFIAQLGPLDYFDPSSRDVQIEQILKKQDRKH